MAEADNQHEDMGEGCAGSMRSLARSLTEHPPAPSEAEEILKAMRWKADMVITNPFGERVWLKRRFNPNGLTDCCLESDPCAHHAALRDASDE